MNPATPANTQEAEATSAQLAARKQASAQATGWNPGEATSAQIAANQANQLQGQAAQLQGNVQQDRANQAQPQSLSGRLPGTSPAPNVLDTNTESPVSHRIGPVTSAPLDQGESFTETGIGSDPNQTASARPLMGQIVLYRNQAHDPVTRPAMVVAANDDGTVDLNVFSLGSIQPVRAAKQGADLGQWSWGHLYPTNRFMI
jgi:hypothetical protein